MEKNYEPKEIENKIYSLWNKKGFFNPDNLSGKKTYTITMPPPNITGELHMGHALNTTIQDVLIRWKRMRGYKTLWVPGTDHAGIATQNVVEKKLKKEGITRFDLGRENFIKEILKWKKQYGSSILNQLKKMGASCDWSRTRFTMDKEYTKAVKKAFLHYYQKGLIYKGKRPVNWCSRCATSLSDLELEYEEKTGGLWFIKYKIKDEKEYLTVATTRPETMLGDTAVAVNLKDKRYKSLIGKKVIVPLSKREVPVISDSLIDIEFGTGALKVTPSHDLKDYEIGVRNNLEAIQIINEFSKITENAPEKYRGLKTLEARNLILEDLEEKNLLVKKEDLIHQVPKCYRCNSIIEVIPSDQWFLKMKELAQKAKVPVQKEEIRFHPKSFKKSYIDWIENARDWCISRQIWWGHKIPLKGEDDVLDTWFSSALWPFAVLGWPEDKKDFGNFYPTNVLTTARDIINFWVARMIFSGKEFTGENPFRDVYIHATVLTRDGKRMSKSLGTGINPMDLIERYGADSTRFGLAYQAMGGQDLKFIEDNIIMGKKFCNKIWNASKFVFYQIPEKNVVLSDIIKEKLSLEDKRILTQLEKTIKSINDNLEKFQFGQAAHKIYDFFWHEFCDKYIEASKKQLVNEKEKTQKILFYVLMTSLKIMHPFIPFVTEEIYQQSPLKNKRHLIIEDWPK